MDNKDIIVIKIFTVEAFLYFIKNFSKRNNIYFIKSDGLGKILVSILDKFNISPKKLSWDNNNIKDDNGIKVFTKVKKKEKYEFSDNILNSVFQNFDNIQNIDKFFMIYLSIMLPNLKIINKKYLAQQILVSISAIDRIFSNRSTRLIFLMPKSYYDEFFLKYGKNKNIKIEFLNNFFYVEKLIIKIKTFLSSFGFIQNLHRGKIFNKEENMVKNNLNSTIVLEDTFQINKPDEFLSRDFNQVCDIYYVDRFHRLTNSEIIDYKEKNIKFLHLDKKYQSKDFPIFITKFKNIKFNLKFNKISDINLLINYLYVQYNFEKIFWKSLFRKLNTKIYLSSNGAQPHAAAAASAINELGGISLGFFTLSLLTQIFKLQYCEYCNPKIGVSKKW